MQFMWQLQRDRLIRIGIMHCMHASLAVNRNRARAKTRDAHTDGAPPPPGGPRAALAGISGPQSGFWHAASECPRSGATI
eukprot:SAG11_NODE_53_length_19648_cov_14.691902_6_plen_80_part_00